MGRNRKPKNPVGETVAANKPIPPEEMPLEWNGVIRSQQLPSGWQPNKTSLPEEEIPRSLRFGVEGKTPDGQKIEIAIDPFLDGSLSITIGGNSYDMHFSDLSPYEVAPSPNALTSRRSDTTLNWSQIIPIVMDALAKKEKPSAAQTESFTTAAKDAISAIGQRATLPDRGALSDADYIRALREASTSLPQAFATVRPFPLLSSAMRNLLVPVADIRNEVVRQMISLETASPAVQKAARDYLANVWKNAVKVAGTVTEAGIRGRVIGDAVRIRSRDGVRLGRPDEERQMLEVNTYNGLTQYIENAMNNRVPRRFITTMKKIPDWS